MANSNEEKTVQSHHIQQDLCTTRLPYRQGRKLTAVKVYTINNESNHLLIFGVPSLNLRREAKSLFSKFGNILQFTISTEHKSEDFTETYHAVYERIHSARIAKKMLDTKNFYGGSLHVCYAPEMETVDETREKIKQRQINVLNRLKNLKKETESRTIVPIAYEDVPNISIGTRIDIVNEVEDYNVKKLNMGEVNTIHVDKQMNDNSNIVVKSHKKRKSDIVQSTKKLIKTDLKQNSKQVSSNSELATSSKLIDCTSTEKDVITNINEQLNYDKFGNERIVDMPQRPLNKIKFYLPNKKI